MGSIPTSLNSTVYSSVTYNKLSADILGGQWQKIGTKGDIAVYFKYFSRLRLRKYILAPSSNYWGCNNSEHELCHAFAGLVTKLCHAWNCYNLTWNIRFDGKEQLDYFLAKLGHRNCKVIESYTHVISMENENYEDFINRKVKSVTRQQIRYGLNSGFKIRDIKRSEDIDQYFALYLAWASKKNVHPFPREYFNQIITELISTASLVGVFSAETLQAAALIWHEGYLWNYSHPVRDYDNDKKYATDILLSNILEDAFNQGIIYFNMGGSMKIQSLENFKERWGAEKKPYWELIWENPFWKAIFRTIRSHRSNS